MHDKRTGDNEETEDSKDSLVLMMLMEEGNHWPWSVAELILALDDEEVIDSINRLQRGGLIHRTGDGLIFPTRATIYSERITEQL